MLQTVSFRPLYRACRRRLHLQGSPRSLTLAARCWRLQRSEQPWASRSRGLLTKAWDQGPREPPLIEQTIPEYFAGIVREHGDRTAVISQHQNRRLTYAELDTKSDALAKGLESLGVNKGERVAVMLGNGEEYCVATNALFKLGAILVPLNPAFNALQTTSALNHLQATHLIISTETNLPHKPPKPTLPLLNHLIPDLFRSPPSSSSATVDSRSSAVVVPSLKRVVVVDNSEGRVDVSGFVASASASVSSSASLHRWDRVLEDGEGGKPSPRSLDADEIVNIQFTSGTTSMPKAACLTHRSILNNGKGIGDRMLLTPEDIVCCPPPMFHCFGCILGYMATQTHGSTIVFPSESFNPHSTLLAVQKHSCTALYGVPTMFIAELDILSQSPELLSPAIKKGLRTGIAAGSSIPEALMKKLHARLGLPQLTICYGMTETSPVSAMTHTSDPLWAQTQTVGRLLPHVSAKIISSETGGGDVVDVGVRGELLVSGYLVMKKYWGDETKTNEVLKRDEHGKLWMHTGDEAEMDEQGYIRITGRKKDIIIRGGENIHPLEIENAVLGLEQVSDVSVVGIPDAKYGEVVVAFVILKEEVRSGRGGVGGGRGVKGGGEPDKETELKEVIRGFVRSNLSPHLVPKHIFFVEGFPKTASGKIQKFKLRELGVEFVAMKDLGGV